MTSSFVGSTVCPHVSVINPDAGPNVPPRYSVESRSIVIS